MAEANPTAAEPGTALVVVPAEQLPSILGADKTDILGNLRRELAGYKPDATTETGRKEIGSKARKVGTAKQDLLRLGKALKEDAQKLLKSVQAEERIVEQNCDAIRDGILAPLEAFKQREADRIKGHEEALAAIVEAPAYGDTETGAEIAERLALLRAWPARDWQEFDKRAAEVLSGEVRRTEGLLARAEKREAEAAELARLRAEEEARAAAEALRLQQEREAQIAAEAAAAAQKAAEERAAAEAAEAARQAQAQREAVEAAAREAQAKVEREKAEAEARAAQAEADRVAAVERAAQEKRDAEERAAQAEAARVAAEQRATADAKALAEKVEAERVAAAAQAERDRLAAVKAEQDRQAAEKAAQEAAEAARAANVAHRTKINRETVAGLVKAMSEVHSGNAEEAEAIAKAVVVAIAKGELEHVRIIY